MGSGSRDSFSFSPIATTVVGSVEFDSQNTVCPWIASVGATCGTTDSLDQFPLSRPVLCYWPRPHTRAKDLVTIYFFANMQSFRIISLIEERELSAEEG